jgi:electron transport complex protein RnfC
MKFQDVVLGEEEMIELEPFKSEEIVRNLDAQEEVFFIGCTGWKEICNPGGEAQMQPLKKELSLRGVSFSGTLVVDALCNKGMDELSLFTRTRQACRARTLLVLSCEVGVRALGAIAGQRVVPALRTLAAEGFQGVLGDREVCRLCSECLLDVSGGLCPLYFCPKEMLTGPCQGAQHGQCEVDPKTPCGWELIYERLKAQGRLEMLKTSAEPRDHSKILPLLRLRSTLAAGRK